MGLGEKLRDYKQISREDLFLEITMTLEQKYVNPNVCKNMEVRHQLEVKTFFFREHHDIQMKIFFLAGKIV